MLPTWTGETVTVRQNGHSVAVTTVDEVERGGLSVEKQDTYSGTPQGGIISPILANIYLDKLDSQHGEALR